MSNGIEYLRDNTDWVVQTSRDTSQFRMPQPQPPPPEPVVEYKCPEEHKPLATGERVKLANSKYGDSESNPRWGGKCGHMGGTVVFCGDTHVYIEWDNFINNSYYKEDIIPLTEEDKKISTRPTPKPKPKFKIGDDIKFVRGDMYSDHEYTPLWGGSYGKILGKVTRIGRFFRSTGYTPSDQYEIHVRWEHNLTGQYYELALEKATATDKRSSTFKYRKPIDLKKIGTIKIKYTVYERLIGDVKLFETVIKRSFCYMLGMDNKNIINMCVPMTSSNRGCSQMPGYSGRDLAKAMVQISRENCRICGLVRIGDFNPNDGDRGTSLREMGWMGESAIIITFSVGWTRAETYCVTTRKSLELPYAIVK